MIFPRSTEWGLLLGRVFSRLLVCSDSRRGRRKTLRKGGKIIPSAAPKLLNLAFLSTTDHRGQDEIVPAIPSKILQLVFAHICVAVVTAHLEPSGTICWEKRVVVRCKRKMRSNTITHHYLGKMAFLLEPLAHQLHRMPSSCSLWGEEGKDYLWLRSDG